MGSSLASASSGESNPASADGYENEMDRASDNYRPPADDALRINGLTFSESVALRQATNNPYGLPTRATGVTGVVVRDFDPANRWDPEALSGLGDGGEGSFKVAAANKFTGSTGGRGQAGPSSPALTLTSDDWQRQGEASYKQSKILLKAAQWASDNRMESEAADYRQRAAAVSKEGDNAINIAGRMNIASQASSSNSSPFAPGWSYMGANSSGLPAASNIKLNGTIGGGIYYGVGGELEVELADGKIVGGKAGLGVGYGVHITRKTISGALMQAPLVGYKSSAIFEYNPQQPGEIRIGPSLAAGVGIGPIGIEQSFGIGLNISDKGYSSYYQRSTNWTTSPVLPKLGGEIKFNLLEFSVKPRQP